MKVLMKLPECMLIDFISLLNLFQSAVIFYSAFSVKELNARIAIL